VETTTRDADDFYEVLTTPALSNDYIFEQDIFGAYKPKSWLFCLIEHLFSSSFLFFVFLFFVFCFLFFCFFVFLELDGCAV